MTDTQIVPAATAAISNWGSRDEVRELNERLTRMALSLPGGARLDRQSILALAQASIAHNLNPLNGEIWIIPGSGLMIGIKGLRKKAREQLGPGGNFEVSYRLIVNPEEKAALNIPAGAIAYETTLTDSASIETYVQQNERLLSKGMPWERVAEMMGPRPCSKGIGFALPSEKSKMGTAQLAMKRAEAHVIKQKFDVNFADVDPADESPITFGGEWIENGTPPAERTAEERAATAQAMDELYGGDDDDDRLDQVIAESKTAAPAAPQSKIWQRWNETVAEAAALGLAVPVMDLAADDADVAKAATDLRKAIAAAKKGQSVAA